MATNQFSTKSTPEWIQQKGSKFLKIALVLGAILISILVPMMFSETLLFLMILMFVAAVGVWLFLRWPALGILILILTALFFPSPRLPGGLNITILLLIALIGLWLMTMIVNKHVTLMKSRPIRPLLALILIAVISFAFGQLGWFGYSPTAPLDAQIGGLLIFVLSVGAFLISAHQTNLRWLQVLTYVFIGLGAIFILGWLIPPIGSTIGNLYQRAPVSNSMFWTWLVALTLGQALFNNKLHFGWRIVLFLILAMTMFVAYFLNSGWKAGYLPPLVAIAAVISARSWRVGLAMALLSIFPAIFLYSNAVGTDEYSYSTRVDAFLIMLEIIKVSPIIGLGPANYYYYTHFFPIRGYFIQFNSHNQYLDLAAQTGILGVICFLWFGVEMALLSLKLRLDAPEGFARAYVYGAIGGLAGTFAAGMLVDWVIPFVYNIGLWGMAGSVLAWIFLGGVLSIEQMTYQEVGEKSSADKLVLSGETI